MTDLEKKSLKSTKSKLTFHPSTIVLETAVRRKTPPQYFSPGIDYQDLLSKLREDFFKIWDNQKSSPENGLDGYDELATLGTGSFGRVILAKQHQNPKYYAVKILAKDQVVKTKQVTHVHNEKRVLAAIKFPFLINLEFSAKDFDNLYLGLPFVNGGELFTYHRKVRKFNEKHARFYAAQVFMGLEYLHEMHFLYRDLKPENILIDKYGYLKITDFGFAKASSSSHNTTSKKVALAFSLSHFIAFGNVSSSETFFDVVLCDDDDDCWNKREYLIQKVESRTLTLCGTPEYLAPEIIQTKPYGTSVDWWSFGILIYELVAGYSPFAPHNRDVMIMYSKICEAAYKMPTFFSAPLKDLVKNLLQPDITKRFGNLINGNKDIKNHAWFKNVDWYSLLNQEIAAPYIPNIAHEEDCSNFDKYPPPKAVPKSKTNRHGDLFAAF